MSVSNEGIVAGARCTENGPPGGGGRPDAPRETPHRLPTRVVIRGDP